MTKPARTARPSRNSRVDIAGSSWSLLNGIQQIAIMETVLSREGVAVPPAKPGEGGRPRRDALWALCENSGLEKVAEAEAGAPPKDPATAPTAAPKARDLWAEFNAIADGAERTAFYQANRNAFLLLARR